MSGQTTIAAEELEALRGRLAEAEDMLRAIRAGEVDAIVVRDKGAPAIYTLKGAADPYRLLVEQMSEGALTLSADGVILYCNDAFARIIGCRRERLIGALFAGLVSGRAPEAQMGRLLRAPAGFGYAIQFRKDSGEIVHAQVSSAPMAVEGEDLHCLVVTDLSRQHLRILHEAIVDSSADAIYAVRLDGAIESWNPAAERLFGYSSQEAIGRDIFMLAPPERQEDLRQLLARVARGEAIVREAAVVSKAGRKLDVSLSLSPIIARDGDAGAIAAIARDVTENKRNEERKRFLLAEVNHRSRNLLAVVQAIAMQTARGADPLTFATSLAERIGALAANQDLLVKSDWGGVEALDVVRAQLSHFDDLIGARLLIEGPPVRLTPAAAQRIGMALHELATNAAKYGALSNASGRVHIAWNVAPTEGKFHLRWQEEGGPEVTTPSRRGFGQLVIGPVTEAAVGGVATVDFPATGLRWALSAPVAGVLE